MIQLIHPFVDHGQKQSAELFKTLRFNNLSRKITVYFAGISNIFGSTSWLTAIDFTT